MEDQRIATLAETYVTDLFDHYDTDALKFHDLEHTLLVTRHIAEIAAAEKVSDEEKLILHIAALFHDTGHLNGGIEGHEQRSVAFMEGFMKANNLTDEQFINRISGCILASRMPHHPADKLQEIMCDADVYHFGTDTFKLTNKKIKKEFEKRGYEHLTQSWLERTYQILNEQHFFTAYCRERLEAGKQKNLARIKKKLDEKGLLPQQEEVTGSEPEETKEDLKMNQRLVTRGVQTVLRLSSQNHLELSQMADGKANILISVNAII